MNRAEPRDSGATRAPDRVTAARFERSRGMVVLELATGLELGFPAALTGKFGDAAAEDLTEIEIGADGLALRWPRLDVTLYVPSVLLGTYMGSSSPGTRDPGPTGID